MASFIVDLKLIKVEGNFVLRSETENTGILARDKPYNAYLATNGQTYHSICHSLLYSPPYVGLFSSLSICDEIPGRVTSGTQHHGGLGGNKSSD